MLSEGQIWPISSNKTIGDNRPLEWPFSHNGPYVAIKLAHLGRADHSAYCALKAAVIGLTRSWMREFAPDILTSAVAPGPVDTPVLSESISPVVVALESDLPLGCIGRPEEIASVIAFLAGPGAGDVTGQTFGPNGGADTT